MILFTAKPELQWQILNENIGQTFAFSMLFLGLKFHKSFGFSQREIVNEAQKAVNKWRGWSDLFIWGCANTQHCADLILEPNIVYTMYFLPKFDLVLFA
jgi:hypothetical protein